MIEGENAGTFVDVTCDANGKMVSYREHYPPGTWDVKLLRDENARLRALLQEAIPHIEGTQNTTSMETFEAAGTLLEKIRAASGQGSP